MSSTRDEPPMRDHDGWECCCEYKEVIDTSDFLELLQYPAELYSISTLFTSSMVICQQGKGMIRALGNLFRG